MPKFTLTWTPVIQPLDLGEYNPAMQGERIPVCVNPPQEIMAERARLMNDFSDRFEKYAQALTDKNDTVIVDFTSWARETFTPKVNDWYAKLFSHGDETYTAEDVAQFADVDLHFYNWLLRRAIEMIDEHRTGRKKNSMPR